MKSLYLLRHAKSSWDDPSLNDFERPLAPRGIKACKLMRAHLRKAQIKPNLIVCSPAIRARDTYNRLAQALDKDTKVTFEKELYEGGSRALLKRLRQISHTVNSVMMIGHNTGLEHLAFALTSGTETESLVRMRVKFPTLALACIEIEGDEWSMASPGCARLADFIIPRDLKEEKRRKHLLSD